jgi:hypothetical protein
MLLEALDLERIFVSCKVELKMTVSIGNHCFNKRYTGRKRHSFTREINYMFGIRVGIEIINITRLNLGHLRPRSLDAGRKYHFSDTYDKEFVLQTAY